MTAALLAEKLVPVIERNATNVANLSDAGITAADIQCYSSHLLNGQKPTIVSAAITRALRAAGFKPTDKSVKSDHRASRSRRVLVWQKA